jgi:hypothetical protein
LNIRLLRLVLIASLTSCTTAFAQTQPFALPAHKGAMLLDLDGFNVTQSSAKPNGDELGIRAHDQENMELLAFLFLTPQNHAQTSTTCLRGDIDQAKKDSAGHVSFDEQLNPNGTDTKDFATALLTYANGSKHLYKYSGYEDQCLVIQIYADKNSSLDLPRATTVLQRQRYDPQYVPSSKDKFIYAGVLYRTEQYKASIPVYANFLANTPTGKETLTARRVATDNMGMALGMSGQVDAARKVFLDAVQKDPTYPLYYYNLACADAEQGDATNAKLHLQQAFDRRANVIKGEAMPDPTKDDSILKLKKDNDFWIFVQTLK